MKSGFESMVLDLRGRRFLLDDRRDNILQETGRMFMGGMDCHMLFPYSTAFPEPRFTITSKVNMIWSPGFTSRKQRKLKAGTMKSSIFFSKTNRYAFPSLLKTVSIPHCQFRRPITSLV